MTSGEFVYGMSVMFIHFPETVCVVFSRFTVIFQAEHLLSSKKVSVCTTDLEISFLTKTPLKESPWQCFVFSSGSLDLFRERVFSIEICLTTLLESMVY